MDFQDIFIIGGTGNVGKTLVRQIMERRDGDAQKHVNPTRIVGLASSRSFVFNPNGLSKQDCLDFSTRKISGNPYSKVMDLLKDVQQMRNTNGNSFVFVDVTASKDLLDFHYKVINDTELSLITANKNPISQCSYPDFQKLTKHPARYGYRCSVMAGAEAVTFLQDLQDVSDIPGRIRGCFSGTLGFICTELEKGRKLSEIVKEAKEKGYTEPHPRDDLNGMDVAKKLLILARTAGHAFGMSDVILDPFVPSELLAADDVDAFLESLTTVDDEFNKRVEQAKANGNVLRYVADLDITGDRAQLSVGLKEVPAHSVLGTLNGTSNKIVVESRAYPAESPYVVEAPGAGLEVTAQNLRRDLLSQLQKRSYKL